MSSTLSISGGIEQVFKGRGTPGSVEPVVAYLPQSEVGDSQHAIDDRGTPSRLVVSDAYHVDGVLRREVLSSQREHVFARESVALLRLLGLVLQLSRGDTRGEEAQNDETQKTKKKTKCEKTRVMPHHR